MLKTSSSCRSWGVLNAHRNHRGVVLVIVLVCLIAVTTILLGSMSTGIRHRQQTRSETQMEQTYLLLDAGIGKAIEDFQDEPFTKDQEIVLENAMVKYNGWLNFDLVDQTEDQITLRVTAKLQAKHELGQITQRSRVIVLKNATSQSEQKQEKVDEESQ